MLIGVIPLMVQVFAPQKILIIADISISGLATRLYALVFAAISLYIGLGLLKLRKRAWIGCVAMYSFGVIAGVINLFVFAKVKKALLGMMSEMADSPFVMPEWFFAVSAVMGLVISILLLGYIYSKKKVFFESDVKRAA